MTTGQRIGELAKKKKINLHQLAKMAGISYNTLYSIVRRKSDKVDQDIVCKIAAALKVPQIEITTGMTEQAWREQIEEEVREFEAVNRERLLAIFAMRNPLFIEALNTAGVTIRLEGKEMYADWEDVSVAITMDEVEELLERTWDSFLANIQKVFTIPIADEYGRTAPSEPLAEDGKGKSSTEQEKPPAGQNDPIDGK